MQGMFLRSLGLVLLTAALAEPQSSQGPRPSEDAGRLGKYMRSTSKKGYNYFVYAPKSYSAENPAGLHLFFHGQGSEASAKAVEHWAPLFLDKYNLVGVNMWYQDGDNTIDTEGKVRAAQEALAQTMADYKIVAGRGIVCSFSGGGLPHAMLYDREARNGRGPSWPFSHASLYSSNYRSRPAHNRQVPMSWLIAVGQAEWHLASLGDDGKARFSELLGDAPQGGSSDLCFKVIKGKGHVLATEEMEEASRAFRRSDLAYAPFVYAPDFAQKELRGAVEAANQLQLGRAAGLLEKASTDAAKALRAKVDARVQAILALMRELAEDDPVLCAAYGGLFLKQFQGHPEMKALKEIVSTAARSKAHAKAAAALPLFQKNVTSFFDPKGMLVPAQAPLVEQIRELAGEKSQLGRMAADYLKLR